MYSRISLLFRMKISFENQMKHDLNAIFNCILKFMQILCTHFEQSFVRVDFFSTVIGYFRYYYWSMFFRNCHEKVENLLGSTWNRP
jgi:hypothetical protein